MDRDAGIFEDTAAYGRHMADVRPWPDIIQIEITSVCNLRCVMCPIVCETRNRAKDERVLSVADLERHRPVFENAYEIELTGFGEIFTHPDLPGVLRFFRETGCTINATTNGMLMDEKRLATIVDENLIDLLCISLDAATQKTLGAIRVGADLERILGNARTLQDLKRARGTDSPRLHLSFITMEQNLAELPAFVRLAADLGAAEVIVQGLNEKDAAKVRNTARDAEAESAIYEQAHQAARETGVALEFWYQGNRTEPADAPALRKYQYTGRTDAGASMIKDCPFPWDRVFIKSNLDVQICATLWEELIMGNLREQPFDAIWLGPAYSEARDRMRGTHPPDECVKCMTKHWRRPLAVDELSDVIDFGDLYAGQLGLGFYPVERDANGRGHRWARRRFTFFVPAGRPILEIELYFHPDAPALRGTVSAGGACVGVLDSRAHWQRVTRFALPDSRSPFTQIDVEFDSEWRPIEHGLPGGYRPIAAMVYAARVTDEAGASDVELVEGWYPPEAGGGFRWSMTEASALIPGGLREVEIEWLVVAGMPSRTAALTIDGERVGEIDAGKPVGVYRTRIAVPGSDARRRVLRIACDGTWGPDERKGTADTRRLGLPVRRIGAPRGLLSRLFRSRTS